MAATVQAEPPLPVWAQPPLQVQQAPVVVQVWEEVLLVTAVQPADKLAEQAPTSRAAMVEPATLLAVHPAEVEAVDKLLEALVPRDWLELPSTMYNVAYW
jgi:hypothetical protein